MADLERGGGRRWALVMALLAISLGELLLRGPVRFARSSDFNDFLSPYIQTRAWMKGVDPYSPRNLVALWPEGVPRFDFLKKDLADGSLVLKRGIPTAYPPTAFVVLTAFAWLPYRVAHAIWLLTELGACMAAVLALASLHRFHRDEKRTYVFMAIAFALAPFQTGLAAGSIAIVAVGGCAVAVWAMAGGKERAGGFLIAVAIALKPQIGLPFLFYYLLRRRWRAAGWAVGLAALWAAMAILYMWLNHAAWLDHYSYDNRILFAQGSLGDFTEGNPLRFSLINLQVLLYTFLLNRSAANVLALAISGMLGMAWLALFRKRDSKTQPLEMSALLVLSLLPVYHRLYDASLLIFPLAWSMTALSGRLKAPARASLLLLLVFLIPGGSALEQLQGSHHLRGLQQSWLWAHFVMPHQTWALIFLSVILLYAMLGSEDGQNEAAMPRVRGVERDEGRPVIDEVRAELSEIRRGFSCGSLAE